VRRRSSRSPGGQTQPSAVPILPPNDKPGTDAPGEFSGIEFSYTGEFADTGEFDAQPEPFPDEPGFSWQPLLKRDPVSHPLVSQVGLVLGWAALSSLVVVYTRGHQLTATTGTRIIGWLFTAVTGVVVAVVIALDRVARHRIDMGLRDADEALRSVELVTDPALSFHPLDVLLDELLRRVLYVVKGDVATIYLMSEGGNELVIRSSRGLGAPVAASVRIQVGVGIIGRVASRARAVIVNDVRSQREDAQEIRRQVASLVAAPLLMGSKVTGVIQVGTSMPHRFRARDVRLLQVVADRTAASIERARLDESARRSRLGAEHARQHLALLARAGEVLSTALESFDEALQGLVEVVVPSFADWFAVDLIDDSGRLCRVAAGSQGSRDSPGSGGVIAHRHPEGDRIVHTVMTSGRPEVLMPAGRLGGLHVGRPALPGHFGDTAPASGIESMLVVPIRVRGLGFGALSFTTGPGRRGYRHSDLETAQDLAERISVAVQRVLLWRESRSAERTATGHAEQLRRLMEASFAINAALEEGEVVSVLVDYARAVLGVPCAAVVMASETSPSHDVSSPAELPEDLAAAAMEAATVVGGSRRLMRTGPGEARVLAGQSRRQGATTPWLGIPLNGGAGRRRALVVIGDAGRIFSAQDESALELLTQLASVSLENAHLYQAVQGNEQRLRAVVESSPLAIVELDLQGTALSWNRAAAELFGWEPEVVTAGSLPVVEGDGTAVLQGLWQRTAQSGRATVDSQVQVRRMADDELLDLSVSAAPLRDRLGSVTGVLAVVADVTERQRMLEQFNQAERVAAMARLAGGVAHDFNNLLTVILGSSEILERRLPGDEDALAEVAAIRRAGQRAAALTGELLAIGHRGQARMSVTDLGEVVESMTPMLESVVGEGVTLSVVSGGEGCTVLADPAEVERVVLNLVINARDATDDGGRIEVRTRAEAPDDPDAQPSVALSVTDDGIGMDAHTASHCFEPFFTTKDRSHGTGLGLAAVHAVVTQSGGMLELDTEPGEGSCFTIRYPVAHGTAVVGTDDDDDDDAPVEGDELVLVVEDERELRRLAAEELGGRGYLVLVAADADEALGVIDSLERGIDLLVTDVVMPGRSGIELAAEVGTRFPTVPVLFVSGHLDEEAQGRPGLSAGADLLAKPYTPRQLVRRVRAALDRAADEHRDAQRPGRVPA
jgi:PAS domain S-box-containing protein